MNLIQRQADDFLEEVLDERRGDYKKFIGEVRTQLWEYKKDSYKIEFIQRLTGQLKLKFDKHIEVCTATVKSECAVNKFFENALFFLQEEIEELEGNLANTEFKSIEKKQANDTLDKILADLNQLKVGQQITYDDLYNEIQDIKDFYFLNKKNWFQLLTGKLTEMVAGGIISETVSKDIVVIIKERYPDIVG